MSELTGIRNFVELDGRVGTSGMPEAEDFPRIARAGYRTVVNIALPTSDYALANEGELVTREGMTYAHVPVQFDAPQRRDFELFAAVMDACRAEKVFVHCAANKRVSAFMFLYRLHRKIVSRAPAEADLKKVWEPDEIWRRFINENLPEGERRLE